MIQSLPELNHHYLTVLLAVTDFAYFLSTFLYFLRKKQTNFVKQSLNF
jgi:hypothetical protein